MPSTRGRVVRGTQAVASPGFPTPALGASQLHTPRRKRNTSSGLSYRCLTPPLSWARKAAQASPFWAWRAHKGREDSTSPGSCQDLPRALPPAQGSNRNSFPSSRQAGRHRCYAHSGGQAGRQESHVWAAHSVGGGNRGSVDHVGPLVSHPAWLSSSRSTRARLQCAHRAPPSAMPRALTGEACSGAGRASWG